MIRAYSFLVILLACLPLHMAHAAKATDEVILFAGRSCATCQLLRTSLDASGMPWRYVDLDQSEGYRELVGWEQKLGVEAQELPVLLHHDRLISGKDAILAHVASFPERASVSTANHDVTSASAATSSPAVLSESAPPIATEEVIAHRMASYGLATVAIAGLVDGVNPCAFATIIFLFGALMTGHHSKRRMVAVGCSFAFGVFITYLLAGMGALRAMMMMQSFQVVRAWFHGVVVVMLLVMSGLFFLDGIIMTLRGGKPMLRMPDKLRMYAHATMARGLHTRRWLLGGLALGMTVSILELACTGQMYLPTIMYMLHDPVWGQQAWMLLILYNVMFIIPLLVVMMASVKGMHASAWWTFMKRHAATGRMAAAIVMAVMGIALWR